MRRVTVVGVGALGSHVVQLLRNVDVTLRVIDFDRVEQKNTQSQFHGKPGVGKSKVQALAQSMQFLWGTKLEANGNKLVAENAYQLLGDSDLIIDCLDNGAGRRVIQNQIRKVRFHQQPCLHGALAPDGAFGRVVWDENFVIDDESDGGAATCEDGEHLPFISIVSSYIAHSARLFLAKGTKVGFSVSPAGAMVI